MISDTQSMTEMLCQTCEQKTDRFYWHSPNLCKRCDDARGRAYDAYVDPSGLARGRFEADLADSDKQMAVIMRGGR